jgi:homoserine O-succinyltransferase
LSIALPIGLPARSTLAVEGIEVLTGDELHRRGGRPLRICLVNLMPNKSVTETQICRLLGATSVPVAVTLCLPDSYRSKTTPASHIASFYRPWSQVRDERFDGLVVTGAPIETLPFGDVTYWSELTAILDWARSHVTSSLYICWAAQAALYRFHAVPKHPLPAKLSGVYRQRVANTDSRLLKGFGAAFPVPVSRYTEVRTGDLPAQAGLTVLADSAETGLCLIEDRRNRALYMFNHLEYDAETLRNEFLRDRLAGKPAAVPANYFPDDDPARSAANVWRPAAYLLFGNWLGEMQRTAWPQAVDEPQMQWAPAALRAARPELNDYADLPIAAPDRNSIALERSCVSGNPTETSYATSIRKFGRR